MIRQTILHRQAADICILVIDEYNVFGYSLCYGIFTQLFQLPEGEQVTLLHSRFKHFYSTAVLLTELITEFLYQQEIVIFLQCRRNGSQRLSVLFYCYGSLSECIDRYLYIIARNICRLKIAAVFLHKSCFHRKCEPCFIAVAGSNSKVFERKGTGFALACSALCAELFAFLLEFLYEFISLQNIRFII